MDAQTPLRDMLDVLCPMNVIVDADGAICNVGPTALRIFGGYSPVKKSFFDVFEVARPRDITCTQSLRAAAGRKLHLHLHASQKRALKAVAVPGPGPDEITVNLSFGISVIDAVRAHALTAADFAPTDLAIEMLYLMEAKSAAMEASRGLSRRLQSARAQAEQQALTDTLTGLSNRRGLDAMLAEMLAEGEEFALMHVDLDYFKAVNDTLGHAAGDFVLQRVAEILRSEVRSHDTVARTGGDEFVLLLRQVAEPPILDQIALRMIERLTQPIPFEGEDCQISASAGTTLTSYYEVADAERMITDADLALYASKNAGRARHTFYTEDLRARMVERRGAGAGNDGAASSAPEVQGDVA
ncbi:GGDEF domain-containing protein [uncultured Roseobacter sp.]|uniref:GGDEF domain-containing protein n=1 Tax=uncultured Roseobacter sp. TaxID=114847 RepID=UPI0026399F44|nr:GGDEF domain-containing protein [uncultured Roseobacter sp.]